MSESIPVASPVLADSVWITLNPISREASLGFNAGRSLNLAERDRAFSVFVAEAGWSDTATSRGVIGESTYAPITPRTGVVKIVGDGPPRYHVVQIQGGWTAWVRP